MQTAHRSQPIPRLGARALGVAAVAFALLASTAYCALPRAGSASRAPARQEVANPRAWARPAAQPASQAAPLSGAAPVKLHTPTARIELGWGKYDAQTALRNGCGLGRSYIVRAERPGIIEYLCDITGLFRRGDPLVRIYDRDILPDLRIATEAMSRVLAQPLIFARFSATASASTVGPPPALGAPPADFPAPTASAPMPHTPTVRRSVPVGPRPAPQTTPRRAGLALEPAAGAEATDGPEPSPAPVAPAAEVSGARPDDARLAAQAEVAAAEETVGQLKIELDARRSLADAGVMAEGELKRFEGQVAKAERELAAARRRLARLSPAEPTRASAAGASGPAGGRAEAPAPVWGPGPVPAFARGEAGVRAGIFTPPPDMTRLAAPRWQEQVAPSDGAIVRRIAEAGQLVKAGDPLLQVRNTNWVTLYANVPMESAWRFSAGSPVTVTFDEYPRVRFKGWINALGRVCDQPYLRAELTVFCESGYYGNDAYSTLLWLAFAAPIVSDATADPAPVQAAVVPAKRTTLGLETLLSGIIPPIIIGGREHAQEPLEISEDIYEGVLSLVEVKPLQPLDLTPDQASHEERLAQLRKWRESFVGGMTTAVFDDRVVLTYPRDNEVGRAIEKMAQAQVSHVPNYCARTLREALGWGLGDAHTWAVRLPERGYKIREDGIPRPGDILVWPFTFGSTNGQHIGVAVQQNGKMMLLSNLSGALGTSEILAGYIAFYKPKA